MTTFRTLLGYHRQLTLGCLSIMRHLIKTTLFICLPLLLLGACGQKGPLFLPGSPSEIRSVDPTMETAERETQDEDDENPVTIQ